MAVLDQIQLSPSVSSASGRFGRGENITAWALVKEILKTHSEYGRGLGGKLSGEPGPPKGSSRPVDQWLADLNELFDPERVSELHGRLIILGLSRLDPELHDYLSSYGFIEALEDELREPFESLLRDQSVRVNLTSARAAVETTLGEPELAESGRVTDTVEQALAQARALAQATTGQVDSIMLLAAVLLAGLSQRPQKAAARLVAAMNRQMGLSASDAPDEHIIELLRLKERYGIQALPSLSESDSAEVPLAPEVERVLAGAARFSGQVSEKTYVSHRRVLAALLAPRWVMPAPEAQRYLRSLGFDLGELRLTLLEFIRENYPDENLDVWEQALLASDYIPPAAGYISDSIREDVLDRLNIEQEVANIAYVLTSKLVQPPLSLGLFGDWGSGKSFFMKKLRQYINNVAAYYHAEEYQTGLPARWCSRVVQIEFNAWHYSDANLWASLVTRIYEALFNEFREKTDEKDRERLEAQIHQAEGVVREAEAQLNEAKSQVTAAETALFEAQEARETEEENLQNLISDVGSLLGKDSQTQEGLKKAAKALGYPEAARSFQALQELSAELSSFYGRSLALGLNLIRSPRALLLMVVLVIAVPFGVGLLMSGLQERLGPLTQWIIEASAFLTGLFAWLRIQVGPGLTLVDQVHKAYREAQRVRQERLKADSGEVKEAKEALARARSEEQAAQNNLQNAQQELLRVQRALAELRPERKLYRLIEERSRSATYSQHLGIISLIRADFEKMSELMNELVVEERDLKEESAPIQRIILYVDDLDRCSPERVVEVLEAVHLLLAFPLFVVVVGVDPRWLRHSLEQRYPHTLRSKGDAQASVDGRPGLSIYSTPQDYLEKIFQIPFALRPVEKEGYQNLVEDLLKPLSPIERVSTVSATADGEQVADEQEPGAGTGTEDTQTDAEQPRAERQPEEPGREGEPARKPARPPIDFSPLNPEQLEFTSWEEADIDRLWPLFRTPRTVKRYINTYRLLRAGLRTEQEEAAFAGTQSDPGQYQVAMLLLAVVTAFPNQSERFLYLLNDWIERPSPQAFDSPAWHWDEIIHLLRGGVGGSAGEEPREPDQTADLEEGSSRVQEPPDPAFEELVDALEMVNADGFQHAFSKAELQKWSWRVARYSFSIQPL